MKPIILIFDPEEVIPAATGSNGSCIWAYLVKRRDGFRCVECGKAEYLVAHHKNNDHADNRLSNGECLCRGCHNRKHPRKPAVWSEESRAKISARHKGVPKTEEHKAKIAASKAAKKKHVVL